MEPLHILSPSNGVSASMTPCSEDSRKFSTVVGIQHSTRPKMRALLILIVCWPFYAKTTVTKVNVSLVRFTLFVPLINFRHISSISHFCLLELTVNYLESLKIFNDKKEFLSVMVAVFARDTISVEK